MDRTYPEHFAHSQFIRNFNEKKQLSGATFDSASALSLAVPESLRELCQTVPDFQMGGRNFSGEQATMDAVSRGMDEYKRKHGHVVRGDVLESAVRTTLNIMTPENREKAGLSAVYDDATTSASGAPMQANRAQVAIYTSIANAVPFAGYIPMSDGLQGKLIIVRHEAGTATGDYAVGDSLDGANSGDPFMSYNRRITLASGEGVFKIAKDDTDGAAIFAGGVDVFVNGVPAGSSVLNSRNDAASAPLFGEIKIGTTVHKLTGNVDATKGTVKADFAPALPSGSIVEASAILNFEALKGKRPKVVVSATSYDFRATFMSGNHFVTQEAKTQFRAEVNMDATSEALASLRNQSANERYREALRAMYAVGKGHITNFSFDATNRQAQRSRADVWSDVIFPIAAADADMVTRTQGFGISCLYVGTKGKAELTSLPSHLFEQSGLKSTNGIYRLGRLYGKWDVYYDAGKIVNETAESIELLAIGTSNDVARNPVIFGDVASPMIMPLATGESQENGYGYYQALATKVNPHQDSARGAALIQLTNFA